MNRLRRVIPPAALVCLLVASGCALFQPMPEAQYEMTALEKAKLASVGFLETYYAQFRDAEDMAAMTKDGRLSPEQIEIYRIKRDLLIKAEKLIKTFDDLVKLGAVPGAEKEAEINKLLNEIAAKIL